MKWVITGSRHINDFNVISKILDSTLTKYGTPEEFIHGNCWGVDKIGGWWASQKRIPVKKFPADWLNYGKAAGPIRNKEMAEYCSKNDLCIAIWDGSSKGTKNMINLCENKGIKVEIHKI